MGRALRRSPFHVRSRTRGTLMSADAQPALRRATNIAAILAYPSFYHMRPILLVGSVVQQQNGEFRVSDSTGSLRIIPDGNVPDGLDEVRGQFWDLGRMKADDPRLAGYDIRATFHIDPEGAWPRPGEVTVIMASSVTPSALPTGVASAPGSTQSPGFAPTAIRAIVLDASRYVDQKGDGHRAVLRTQPERRSSRRAAAKPLRLRAAVGRRLDLGDQRPPQGKGFKGKEFRARARRAHRHREVAADIGHGRSRDAASCGSMARPRASHSRRHPPTSSPRKSRPCASRPRRRPRSSSVRRPKTKPTCRSRRTCVFSFRGI